MMRISSGNLAVIAVIGLAALGWAAYAGTSDAERELAQQEERSQRCELQRTLRDSFAAFLDRVHERLEHGEVSLPTASDQVLTFCRQGYPTYLHHLVSVESGATWGAKVAQNLVRYFRPLDRVRPAETPPATLARLEYELEQILQDAGPVAQTTGDPRITFE